MKLRMISAGCAIAALGLATACSSVRLGGDDLSDDAIHNRVEHELSLADTLDETDVVVRVEDGVVHLSGSVDAPYTRDEMVRLARDVKGVRDVVHDQVLINTSRAQ